MILAAGEETRQFARNSRAPWELPLPLGPFQYHIDPENFFGVESFSPMIVPYTPWWSGVFQELVV